MFKRYVGEIEVNAFEQQVGCNQYTFVVVVENGGVVAYTLDRRSVSGRYVFGETMYEAEFSYGGDVGPLFVFHSDFVIEVVFIEFLR